ncbi:MAG TPA: hypothetical protein VK753_05895 [Xanthomonadaceae bacterium]|nr:hypothetical protein [Xanthomonadaceae bacterium]
MRRTIFHACLPKLKFDALVAHRLTARTSPIKDTAQVNALHGKKPDPSRIPPALQGGRSIARRKERRLQGRLDRLRGVGKLTGTYPISLHRQARRMVGWLWPMSFVDRTLRRIVAKTVACPRLFLPGCSQLLMTVDSFSSHESICACRRIQALTP